MPYSGFRWKPSPSVAVALLGLVTAICGPQVSHAQMPAELEAAADVMPRHVRALYEQRDYRPVWLADGRLTPQGRRIVQSLSSAAEEGLDPDDYHVSPVPDRALPAAMRVEVEIQLSASALDFAADMTKGRVDPRTLHDGWNLSGRALDPVRLLASMADGGHAQLEPHYEGYRHLRDALARYRRIEKEGGWSSVPPGPPIRLGDRDDRISILKSRLFSTGDLSRLAADTLFAVSLDEAVRAFQRRHGLDVDGIVGRQTLEALNVPVRDRIRQIELNLERWRWMPASLGARHGVVNIPGYRFQVVENGEIVLDMKAIVGKPSTKSPLFSSSIDAVVLAPYWYVPQSIAKNEILPRLNRDPTYLTRNRIRRLPGGMLRQDPGPGNPLGRVKFIIANPFGVRMHDTSEPWLFARSECAFSHGCIRLEKPIELALYVLEGTEWTQARIEDVIRDWEETHIDVESPLPVHVLYWTAWADSDGTVHFRRDVYGHDAALLRALVRSR